MWIRVRTSPITLPSFELESYIFVQLFLPVLCSNLFSKQINIIPFDLLITNPRHGSYWMETGVSWFTGGVWAQVFCLFCVYSFTGLPQRVSRPLSHPQDQIPFSSIHRSCWVTWRSKTTPPPPPPPTLCSLSWTPDQVERVSRQEKQEQEETKVSQGVFPWPQMCLSLPSLPPSTRFSPTRFSPKFSALRDQVWRGRREQWPPEQRGAWGLHLSVSHSWEIRIADPPMVLLHSWNLKKKIQITTVCVQSTLQVLESSVCWERRIGLGRGSTVSKGQLIPSIVRCLPPLSGAWLHCRLMLKCGQRKKEMFAAYSGICFSFSFVLFPT